MSVENAVTGCKQLKDRLIIIIIIMIIQEISIAHNPELKAGAQCTHRKTQNELPIKTKRQSKHTITTTH